MKTFLHSKANFVKLLLLAVVSIVSNFGFAQSAAPELVFKNPVLVSGIANKQGAVYRFSNIAPGVDGEIKLKKFSRADIVMQDVDLSSLGWDKAFQPQFGLPGLVLPFQNWYVDFELGFFKAGTNTRQKMSKVVLTTLDVDGDGNSINEYAVLNTPTSVTYSTVSYLQGLTSITASLGQTFACATCGVVSILKTCNTCGGDGLTNSGSGTNNICDDCEGTGMLQSACNHAYEVPTTVEGPVENFVNIDTLATQVMATYSYVDKDRITFRYGAKSGVLSSNGSGIRLNSMWFKSFNLAPQSSLPVKLSNFSAVLDNGNVRLSWTGHEENFSHYVLQRSTDGKNYSDVAVVFPGENTSNYSDYKYKDANVSSATGMVFYRLEMVDNTHESKFSEIRTIRLGKEKATVQLTTFPNPVTDQVRISLPASWQGKRVVLELYSGSGVKMQGLQINNASQTETMQMGKISKGIYVVKAICDGATAQQQVVKN